MQVRVLTLNIWGVRYISKFIDQRIQAFTEYLLQPDIQYDIIGLQEVWSKNDFAYIHGQLNSKYPYSYYFLSGLVGSGCCVFSQHPIIAVHEHRYTLNGFPHKIQHGDWFCGKLIGLCKILMHGHVINVYNTHLHANYHHVIPKDIYLGHRICQSYELIQFIENTSSDRTDLVILLGDLNLRKEDLGMKLIQGMLKLNDSFLQRIHKDIYDPSVGNSGRTCDLLDNPYVHPHPHQGQGDRIDYILYRARNENVQCLECYPTLHKVPNNANNLHYSDHLAVCALFEIDEKISTKEISHQESLDNETCDALRSACILIEESIQRIQRHRYYCFLIIFSLFFILFSFNSLHFIFILCKNFVCLIGLALSIWFLGFGKPVERNALQSIQNAMRLRLRMEISREIYFIFFGCILTILVDLYLSLITSYSLFVLCLLRVIALFVAFFSPILLEVNGSFWRKFKNLFVCIAAIEQALVIYYFKFDTNTWTVLYLIQQVSMPLFVYLWIRRNERANFTVLRQVWLEIIDVKVKSNSQSGLISERLVLERLFRYSLPDWRIITFGIVILLLGSLSEVFVPLYTGRLLSSVAFRDDWLQFKYNLIMFVVINFAGGFFGGCRSGVFSVCISRISIRLRTKVFKAYLKQEIGFFDTNESGKLLSRLNHDTHTMSSILINNVPQFIGASLRFIGTFIMMIKISLHLTITCLIGAPIILFVAKLCGTAHGRIANKTNNLSAEASEIAEETIQIIRTVRSFGNEEEELKRFESTLQQSYKVSLIQAALSAAQRWFVDLAQLCMSIVMLSYGAKLVRDNHVTGPDLLAFIIYQLTLGGVLSEVSQIYSSLMTAVGASQSVFEYLDRKPVQKPSGILQPHEFRGDIEFKNVSLVYPARPDEQAIQNISFKIPAGQTCAFVGPSGSGKSTCINLLERFYDPTEGEILIDNRNIDEYDHKYLHKKLALVGQEPVLFNRSIRENISYAFETNDQSKIIQAAQDANAHRFITELMQGYQTSCGQRGGHLSGGQKQRVSIARAIIRNPTILLLDEATSALDPVNERLIQDALFYNKTSDNKRTVLISAHRLSTVERCDQIFVIHKGRLAEQGTHEQLMSIENGIYRELVRRQRMNLDDN